MGNQCPERGGKSSCSTPRLGGEKVSKRGRTMGQRGRSESRSLEHAANHYHNYGAVTEEKKVRRPKEMGTPY